MTDVSGQELSWISPELAIGPRLASNSQSMEQLRKLGFSQVIDLNADPTEKKETLRSGLVYHGLKVMDDDSIEDWLAIMFRASEIIEAVHLEKKAVFLHCTFGVGRSPTVAMAYLISSGHSVDEAVALVKKKRPDTWNLGNPVTKYKAILSAFWMQLAAQRSPNQESGQDRAR